MTTLTNTTDRVARKSLAEQIDRLDRLLDGLAQGINDTVVRAVQEAVGLAVQQAVQAALVEVLTNAQIHKMLYPAPPAESVPAPATNLAAFANLLARVAVAVHDACRKLNNRLSQARVAAAGLVTRWRQRSRALAQQAGQTVKRGLSRAARVLCGLLSAARAWRGTLTLALAAGGALGVTCYFGGSLVGALVSGLAGFAGALTTLVHRGQRASGNPAVQGP
jgi:hypothetical protein